MGKRHIEWLRYCDKWGRKFPEYTPIGKDGELLKLPATKDGVPIPSSDSPHSQIGWRKGTHGDYRQTREWGSDGVVTKRTDWSVHGGPKKHTYPHDHVPEQNTTGGTFNRGRPLPFTITRTAYE